MEENINFSVQGFIKIKDKHTNEIILDTENSILYGNMSIAVARAIIGNKSSLISYIGLGNGGAYINSTGTITYKPSIGGAGSAAKNPTANLYNTIFAKKISNDRTNPSIYDNESKVYSPPVNYAVAYEDIIIDTLLDYNEVPPSTSSNTIISQLPVDNSPFSGTNIAITDPSFNPNQFVFNEMALYIGTDNLFPGTITSTTSELAEFIAQTPDFSNNVGTKSKLMISHAIFHPQQKAANKALQIIYTLRFQMGI